MQALIDAKDSDVFDVLAYVRFSLDPKTRHQRADTARGEGLSGYEAEMREFLREVLSAYEREGAAELGYEKLTSFLQVRYGSISDAKSKLGELGGIRGAFKQLQRYLYRD
jgi:type I restriction enzyme R subunit